MNVTKSLPLAAVAALALPGVALAQDRNHDGIPDGWEKAHHLSLRVNQANRDQDHDGLNNLAEFRHHSNPRKANTRFVGSSSQTPGAPASSSQGNAGTVTSFDGQTLVITLADGSTLKGTVTNQTDVTCQGAGGNEAGDDNGAGDDNQQGDANQQSGDRAQMRDGGDGNGGDDNSQGDDDGQQSAQSSTCTIAQNDPVREADLKATSAGPIFEEVKLAK